MGFASEDFSRITNKLASASVSNQTSTLTNMVSIVASYATLLSEAKAQLAQKSQKERRLRDCDAQLRKLKDDAREKQLLETEIEELKKWLSDARELERSKENLKSVLRTLERPVQNLESAIAQALKP
jgi:molecular chaperone DnaK (HSP70)